MTTAPGLVPAATFARMAGRTLRTLHAWRKSGYGPDAVRVRGRWCYRAESVAAFLARGDAVPVAPVRASE